MTLRRDLQSLIDKQQPATARAFHAAIRDITDRTVIRRIVSALRVGDVNAAIQALNIEAAVWAQLQSQTVATYSQAGGLVTAAQTWRLPDGNKAIIRWDMANPVAETWVRNQSSELITRISNQTVEGVRAAIGNGYAAGKGPQSIALDIVGRIGATGVRSGGLVGLTVPQVNHVDSMRARLRSGDPKQLRAVLRMTKRDRRFDGIINRAVKDGTRITSAQVTRMTQRYSDRLLKLRGDTIARTETARAVEAGRLDSFRQGASKAQIPREAIYREWLHGGFSADERPSHAAAHGRTIKGLDNPWDIGGALMMHPLDTSLGAGAEHVANCRCMQNIRVDYGYLNRNG